MVQNFIIQNKKCNPAFNAIPTLYITLKNKEPKALKTSGSQYEYRNKSISIS